MELSGFDFEYAGVSSRTYGLIFANVDIPRQKFISGQTDLATIINKRDKRRYFIDTVYDTSALSFEAEVICNKEIEKITRRKIEKWLFCQSGFRKLYICSPKYCETIDGEEKWLYLNCKLINPSVIEACGVVGYRFTVECDSHLAWQDAVVKEYSDTSFTVHVDTDAEAYTYPKVTIVTSGAGEISIVNETDDGTRKTTFSDIGAAVTLVIDGRINYVSGDYYSQFTGRNFIRLLDGDNVFSVTGNVQSVTFEWQNQRYL